MDRWSASCHHDYTALGDFLNEAANVRFSVKRSLKMSVAFHSVGKARA